jgi:hypothetical protein
MEQTAITISIHRCYLLGFCPDGSVLPGVSRLVALFADLGLPVDLCEQGFVDPVLLEELVLKIGPPRAEKMRKVLLVCGSFLEEQISLAAHYMLAKGYAVHLLRDIIVSKSPEHDHIHDQRLLHAGAVSTTLQQLMYEWIATETDDSVKRTLAEASFT